MASLNVTQKTSARNGFSVVSGEPVLAAEPRLSPSKVRRSQLCPTRHLTSDQYIRLLRFIEDEGGVVTLDEISRALPAVRQPVSAVFDLCDVGILTADFEAAFDGDMRIWRADR